MRDLLGHEPGTAQQAWFAGTEYESRTCPRRQVIDNPDVTTALSLWRACEGKPGVESLRILSPHATAAFAVIDAARAAKLDDERRQREASADTMPKGRRR
jgi:hypothetical protein